MSKCWWDHAWILPEQDSDLIQSRIRECTRCGIRELIWYDRTGREQREILAAGYSPVSKERKSKDA